MDSSGRPLETEMIDGDPYSVDELKYKYINNLNNSEWEVWYHNLSREDQDIVDRMLRDWAVME